MSSPLVRLTRYGTTLHLPMYVHVNVDQILTVERYPDTDVTTVTLVNKETVAVTETPDRVGRLMARAKRT